MSECYKVAAEISHSSHPRIPRDNDSSDDEIVPSSQPTTPPSQPVIPTAISTPATQPVPDTVDPVSRGDDRVEPIVGSAPAERPQFTSSTDSPPPARRSSRQKRRPVHLDDYVTDFT